MNQRLKRKISYTAWVIVFLFPFLFGVILFQFIPLGVAFHNSLHNMGLMNQADAKFVWFANYIKMFQNIKFLHALTNSLLYTLGKLLLQLPLGLVFALLVNQNIPGRTLLRIALIIPLVASEVVIGLLWNIMFFPDIGLFNSILARLGLPMQGFITDASQAMPSIITVMVWQEVGFTMLLFLASLQTIPEEFYEASCIDGAGAFESFRYITLPFLRRAIFLAAFMATLSSFRVFTPIYIMTQGGPQGATISAIYYIYEQAFKFLNLGSASAMAIVFIIILGILTFLQSRLLRTDWDY